MFRAEEGAVLQRMSYISEEGEVLVVKTVNILDIYPYSLMLTSKLECVIHSPELSFLYQ